MIQIAGGVVWNPPLGVVVVNQNHNSWSLPKGHIEPDESLLDAAVREIREETGIPKDKLEFITALGSYERARIPLHPNDEPELRTITLYLFKTDVTTLAPEDPENPEAIWVKQEEVPNILTHPKDKEFFETLTHSGVFKASKPADIA